MVKLLLSERLAATCDNPEGCVLLHRFIAALLVESTWTLKWQRVAGPISGREKSYPTIEKRHGAVQD